MRLDVSNLERRRNGFLAAGVGVLPAVLDLKRSLGCTCLRCLKQILLKGPFQDQINQYFFCEKCGSTVGFIKDSYVHMRKFQPEEDINLPPRLKLLEKKLSFERDDLHSLEGCSLMIIHSFFSSCQPGCWIYLYGDPVLGGYSRVSYPWGLYERTLPLG
ncbi:hypothetical protein TNCT_38751 [Trichonephila clavata]|uniref:Uncharacterized protein n=1 Tax=Trichonephila clavata TaxID=2740835 RepID=A0A8X6KY44_TRICU|nr:hypothetical protein TNCT_38751 [Trichonephila clavata]